MGRKELRGASGHFATWCMAMAEDHERFDDPLTMDFFIAAVRTAIVASDLDYASELLRTNRELRWNFAEQRSLFGRMIQMYPDLTDAFDIEFEAFFDKVRDPDYHDGPPQRIEKWIPHDREMLALETGIIREMYVVRSSPHDAVDPKAVIEAIAL